MDKWKTVRLDDVLNYEQPTKYIVESTDYSNDFKTPVLTAGQSFVLGYTDETENIFDNYPVIIFDDFTTAIKYVDFPFKVKSSAMKILKATQAADIKYLFYYMSTIKCDTQLHKRYWISKYANIEIPLPPLPVQCQIADVLDRASALIEKRKAQIEKLDLLVKSQFVEMFGDPVTNPNGWPVKKLGDIFAVGSSKRIYQAEQTAAGVPFFRISDLVEHIEKGKSSSDLFISEEQYSLFRQKGLVPTPGDILVTSRGTLGQCYIIHESDQFYFQDGMISWLKKGKAAIDSIYITFLFKMKGFRKQIDEVPAGSTVNYLSIARLEKLDVMYPDYQIQNQFADFVHQVEVQKSLLQQSLAKLEQSYKSLIQKCFRGEIF